MSLIESVRNAGCSGNATGIAAANAATLLHQRQAEPTSGELLLLVKLFVEQSLQNDVSVDRLPYTQPLETISAAMHGEYPEGMWDHGKCYRTLLQLRKAERIPRLHRTGANKGKPGSADRTEVVPPSTAKDGSIFD